MKFRRRSSAGSSCIARRRCHQPLDEEARLRPAGAAKAATGAWVVSAPLTVMSQLGTT